MAERIRTCALVPVFNNAGTVASVVRACLDHVGTVIVVDDGSTDGSGSEVEGIAGVVTVRLGTNRGKGEAIRAGLEEARRRGFSHAIALDADGQHDPSYIAEFERAIARNPGAIIAGTRRLAEAGAPASSRFGRSFSNFWYAVETWRSMGDAQCGFRAYPVDRTLALRTRANRYPMEHEVVVLASWSGMEVRSDVGMDVRYGEGIVSHFDKIGDNARFSALNAGLTMARYSGAWRLMRRDLPPAPGATAPAWVSGRSLGNRFGYGWFEALARIGGPEAAYRFLDVVVPYYCAFAPAEHRAASLDYLGRVFPDASAASLRVHMFRHFRRFGESVVDQAIIPAIGMAGFDVGGVGLEHIREAAAGGRGLILLGAHVGPWQFGATGLGTEGVTVTIAAVVNEARALDAYLDRVRSSSRAPMPRILRVSGETAFGSLTVIEALRAGSIVALHGDRHISGKSSPVTFLGAPASFSLGPFVLSEVTGVPIAPWFATKESGRRVTIEVHDPFGIEPGPRKTRGERMGSALARYAGLLEDHVRKHPYEWYNFYDFWGSGPPGAGGSPAGGGRRPGGP